MFEKNLNRILFSFFVGLFLTGLIMFSPNIPLQDDWNNLYLLNNFENTFLEFLLVKENNHFQVISRFFLYINDKFFSLNYKFNNYISFLLLFFLFFKTYLFLKVKNNLFFILLVLLFFSGRLFPIVTQSVNVVWILSFIFIIYFLEEFKPNDDRISIKLLFIIFLNIINFSLHICVLLFLITNLFFSKHKKNILTYIFFYFLILISLNLISNIFVSDYNLLTSNPVDLKLILSKFELSKFIFTLFSILPSVYFPIIKSFVPISFFVGIIQFIILILLLIKKKYLNFENFQTLLNINSLLIFGMFASMILAFFRPFDSMEARFTLVSIMFQVGFWNCIMRETRSNLFKSFILKTSFLAIFLVGYFSPHLGMYWQTVIYNKSLSIKECLKRNNLQTKKCDELIYFHVFNNGKWFTEEKFNNVLNNLKRENKYFFDEKYINH